MRIFINELNKLLFSPALIVFIILCLVFNVFIIAIDGVYFDYADYVAEASKTTGYRLDADFEEKIADLKPSEERDWLKSDTADMTDVFDDYNTAHIADAYIGGLGLSGYTANAIQDKYAKLQNVVDNKAEGDESLTLYFASATYHTHSELHGTISSFLLLECGLLAALIMLLSLGYEHHNNTSHTVFTTKTGRNVMYSKLLAGLITGLGSFAVLTALTLAVYFVINDYGNVWGSSISSGFNYINDIFCGGSRPFVTWRSYTVLTYLLAALGISALVTLCFGLMAAIIGTWLRNSYIGFMVFLIVNAACIVFALVISGLPRYITVLSPVWLWMKRGAWFTDGGADILWENFETLGVCVSLLVLAGLSVFSTVMQRKRDIA